MPRGDNARPAGPPNSDALGTAAAAYLDMPKHHKPRGAAPDEPVVRVAAVGDLLLASSPVEAEDAATPARLAAAGELLADADVVVANLECTLPGDGTTVPTEPRVVARPEWIEAIARAGVSVVCLANNHMFDCLETGFRTLRDRLSSAGIGFFGAGEDLAEAAAPLTVEVGGKRLAFVAGVDERSGPSALAAPGRAGVAPLDMDALTDRVRRLAASHDRVMVSLHWGDERFRLPSPEQIRQAHALVDAGAAAVLGHHPHVLQGLETYRGVPIIYSLGNFLANTVYWQDGDRMHWNRHERTGCILWLELGPDGRIEARQEATYDDGHTIRRLDSPAARRLIGRRNRAVMRGVRRGRYRREHLRVRVLRPILAHLRWRELRRLRWRNVRNAMRNLRGSSGSR